MFVDGFKVLDAISSLGRELYLRVFSAFFFLSLSFPVPLCSPFIGIRQRDG
jgi:hypothetical protein